MMNIIKEAPPWNNKLFSVYSTYRGILIKGQDVLEGNKFIEGGRVGPL